MQRLRLVSPRPPGLARTRDLRLGPVVSLLLALSACDTPSFPAPDGPSLVDAGAGTPASTDGGRSPGRDDDAGSTLAPPVVADAVIEVDGRRLLVDGEPYEIRGVCWHPVERGAFPPPDYAGFADRDIPLMRDAGINTVRTYAPIRDRAVLDQLADAGIRVIESVYAYGGADPSVALEVVRAEADHPAILMWALGNEWNYNGLYAGVPFEEARDRLERIARDIRAVDATHPIATIYGEVPSAETVEAMPSVDVWGLNVYRGIGFWDLFDVWAERSDTPMFFAEYGADAFDARRGSPNLDAQAEATRTLTEEWMAQSSARWDHGVALGGTVFELADEWWKSEGDPGVQDDGGAAPGGGPHPDGTFNEEWWGLVDMDRKPRPAYDALRDLFRADLP